MRYHSLLAKSDCSLVILAPDTQKESICTGSGVSLEMLLISVDRVFALRCRSESLTDPSL